MARRQSDPSRTPLQAVAKRNTSLKLRRLSLKDLPESERPREKLIRSGESALSEAELLALILGSGSHSESALTLAQRILKETGDLGKLSEMSVRELVTRFHGIGPARAAQLKAALELSHRLKSNDSKMASRFSNSTMVFREFDGYFRGRLVEEFWILALDAKNKLRSKSCLSKGTLMGSLVHPREVFRAAIKEAAAGIIVVHNHPSGESQPSSEDRRVTKQMAEAGTLLGIPLLDHVIIGMNSYFSFKDAGLL
jgi:DNA repair protein RadC